MASPDAGTSASVYDEAGNLVSRSNALGERVELSWDALNRPVRIQWPGSVRPVEFSWDQDTAGRLTGIQEEEFERRFGYDGLGRVTQERVSRAGVSLSVGYGYDEATGELGSITYPSGTVLQYSYDAAGRISGLRFGEHDLARDIRYLPFGPVTGMRLGGVNLSRSYDQRYQASRIQSGSLDYVYTRNAAGQVTESKGLAVPAVESGSESYSIDAASNQLTVRAGKNYSYDAAGRLLSDGVRSFGWDALGRLKTVRRNGQELAGYGYDSQNRRVRKTVGAKTTYYLYDLESRLIAEIAGSGRVLREYVWLGQEPVALREYELRPGLYYYINDHLGTPQRLITGEGTVVWQAAALPFGRTQVQLGTVQNNLRFPGQYFDAETGLHYNWNRYYDPETGRYLSPDPIGLDGGLNLYAYVENDPVNLVDPEGLAAMLNPYAPSPLKKFEALMAAGKYKEALEFAEIMGLSASSIVAAKAALDRTKRECGDDPCSQHEKICVGTAKTVEAHNYGTSSKGHHMHPGVCSNLADKINKANAAGCGNKPGVIYAKGVFNAVCSRDWSGQYPNNTPKFPPYN